MNETSPGAVKEIFRSIAHMEGKALANVPSADRPWVSHFAWSVTKANAEQFDIIWPAALHVLARYNLLP